MDPEEKKLLRRTFDLAKENQALLKKLHKSMVWGRVFRILYWVLIIGIGIGVFYFVQPYIDTLFDTYKTLFPADSAEGSAITPFSLEKLSQEELEGIQETLEQLQQ